MNVREINVQDLAAKIAVGEPVCLVDVRQPWEHELAALPNSRLIPLNELPVRAGEVQPGDGELVVVYCHHGIRSLNGAAFLQQMGMENVVSMAGGIDAWSLIVDPKVLRY